MRRRGLVLLLGLVVIMGGWWIAQQSSSARPEVGVLDVWATWGDEPDLLQGLLDRHSQHSGVPVRVATRVRSDDLLKALASADAPDLAILSSGDWVELYRQQGLVEELGDWMQTSAIDLDDIFAAPLAQCQGHDGALSCLPWGCDVDALLWNKDLFAAAGLDPERPPQTMEELAEYALKLTVRDEKGRLSQVGFIPDLPRSHTELYVRMFGGAFYSEASAELALSSQPVIDALNWEVHFYDAVAPAAVEDLIPSFTPHKASQHPFYAGKRLSCQQCHRSSPTRSRRAPDTGFSQGKIAMMVDGQWHVSPNAPSNREFPVSVGVAPFPPPAAHPERANITMVQGPVLIVPARSEDKEAAVRLLDWMMTPEIVAEAAYAHSLLPSSRQAAQDPRFQGIPGFTVYADLMARPLARSPLASPLTPELNEALCRVEAEVLHNGAEAMSQLTEAQSELAATLEEALPSNDGR